MEEKDVQRLLDMLYSMIDEAKSAAFSSEKCTINRDEALDLLDADLILILVKSWICEIEIYKLEHNKN